MSFIETVAGARGPETKHADIRAAQARLRDAAEKVCRAVRMKRLPEARDATRELPALIKAGLLRSNETHHALKVAVEEASAREVYNWKVVSWLMHDDLKRHRPEPVDEHEPPTIAIRTDNGPDVVDQAEAALIDAQLGVYRRGNRTRAPRHRHPRAAAGRLRKISCAGRVGRTWLD